MADESCKDRDHPARAERQGEADGCRQRIRKKRARPFAEGTRDHSSVKENTDCARKEERGDQPSDQVCSDEQPEFLEAGPEDGRPKRRKKIVDHVMRGHGSYLRGRTGILPGTFRSAFRGRSGFEFLADPFADALNGYRLSHRIHIFVDRDQGG